MSDFGSRIIAALEVAVENPEGAIKHELSGAVSSVLKVIDEHSDAEIEALQN
jgi:hypothetical protein